MATLTRLARAGFSLEEEELPVEMKRPLPPRRLFLPVTTMRIRGQGWSERRDAARDCDPPRTVTVLSEVFRV